MSTLRRIEYLRGYLKEGVVEVCAEADCSDDELVRYAKQEHGGKWRVVRDSPQFAISKCPYDRRRAHFVLEGDR
jgi:hypothetical protein